MFFVASENLLPMLVALLIGFVTGLWVWKLARRPAETRERVLTEDESMRRPYVEDRPPAPFAEPRVGAPRGPRPEPEVLARRQQGASANAALVSVPSAVVEDPSGQVRGADAAPATDDASDGSSADDELQTMKGLGPKLASLLRAQGLTRFEQIAALTPDDLAGLDAHFGAFKGRLARDRIVEQAAFLARGDREGYERAFGKL